MLRVLSTAAAILTGLTFAMAPPTSAEEDTVVTPLMSKPLGMDGKEGLVITVDYAPGASTPIHRHDAHLFVYMLEGSAIFQVEGGEPATLQPGDMFYEQPTDIHTVSKNASDTEPAKFLVFFVKDEGKAPVLPAE